MLTLKQQIDQAKDEVFSKKCALKLYEDHLKELEDTRVNCKHKFSKAFPGYEHEGGECIYCGINELFAPTLSYLKGVKYEVQSEN